MAARPLPLREWSITFLMISVVGAISIASPRLVPDLAVPLLPGGVAVSATIRWGRRMWPALLLARMGMSLLMHKPLIYALGVAAGVAAGAVATSWLLERHHFDPSFKHARDVPLFIIAAALGMMLAPTLGISGACLAGHEPSVLDLTHWLRWWSNTTVGAVVVGPLIVGSSRSSFDRIRRHWGTGVLWSSIVILGCVGALTLPSSGAGRPLLVTLALLLVVVGAIRFGLVVAASAAFALSAAAGLGFAFGQGVFGHLDTVVGYATLWSFSALLSGSGLIITALLAERDSAGAERLQAERRYAQIFDANPQPSWVHDPATLEFLLVNEAAVRQYGWSREEFLERRVPALAAPGSQAVRPSQGGLSVASPPDPFETRHLTRDGRVLAVEVWTCPIDLEGRAAVLAFASDVTERRALGSALIDVVASEQRRIGRELHDGLGQELTGLALSARALSTRAEREGSPLARDLDQIAGLAGSCIQATRRIAQGMSPLSDADGNLAKALEVLAARSCFGGTQVRFRVRADAQLTLELETRNHLYRIAQEAVQNALKHAHANRIDIDLWVRPGLVTLGVRDDGVGLPGTGSGHRGLGMRTMHFRAGSIGGHLSIVTQREGGVAVSCEVAQAESFLAMSSAAHAPNGEASPAPSAVRASAKSTRAEVAR